MDFKGLAVVAGKMKDAGTDALGGILDDINAGIPIIHALGFNINGMRLEAGIPPGISAKLVGAVENIDVTKIKDLGQKHADNRVIVLLLKALETAYNF